MVIASYGAAEAGRTNVRPARRPASAAAAVRYSPFPFLPFALPLPPLHIYARAASSALEVRISRCWCSSCRSEPTRAALAGLTRHVPADMAFVGVAALQVIATLGLSALGLVVAVCLISVHTASPVAMVNFPEVASDGSPMHPPLYDHVMFGVGNEDRIERRANWALKVTSRVKRVIKILVRIDPDFHSSAQGHRKDERHAA